MPLQQKSAQTRSCYAQLRHQLLHGQLTPGSRLVEEKWAAHLNVNRSALREALSLLAHEGFLEVGPRGGFFVPQADDAARDEVLEVRLALEVGAIQILELQGAMPSDGLAAMKRVCEQMEQFRDAGLDYGFAEADRRFHEILVEMAGNPRLKRIFHQAPLLLACAREPDEALRRENMTKTIADHRELVRLLEQDRLAEARALLRRHLLVDHHGATRRRAESVSAEAGGASDAAG